MNDLELERQLRDRGTSWRTANHDRPGVDWDAVTAPRRHGRRTWYAVAGTAVAAAAIIIPLALAGGSSLGSKPLSPAAARKGAPRALVLISQGRVTFQDGPGSIGVWPSRKRPVAAIGVGPSHEITYTASPLSGCRTLLDRAAPHIGVMRGVPSFDVSLKTVQIVAGGPASSTTLSLAPAMAVSPDGTKLAMVMVPPNPAHSTSTVHVSGCNGPEEIVIVNLTTGSVERTHAQGVDERVGSLAWSPDSRQLAFEVTPLCGDKVATLSSCNGLAALGAHVMDTSDQLRGLDQAPEVLPYRSDISTDTPYDGNVFWWHGQLATIQGGKLRALDGQGGLGRTLAKGFPANVLAVSSDSSGDHLLVQAGSIVVAENGNTGTITATAATYRWDRGVLAPVIGGSYSIAGAPTTDLFQPGW
jgi:hypothetical protein